MRRSTILVLFVLVCSTTLVVLAGKGFFSGDNVVNRVDIETERDLPTTSPSATPRVKTPHQPLADALGVSEQDMVEIGGVKRPKRDLAFGKNIRQSDESPASPWPKPGKSIPLKGDESPQIAEFFKEFKAADGPIAAKTAFKRSNDFVLEEYKTDPTRYLDKIRPGRVYESAQPEPGVVPIESEVARFQSLIQGESAILRVKVEPGMPVTYYTPTTATFDNKLPTITVAAGKDGVASAKFLAGPGTIGVMNVLASSPVHSGQVNFKIDVALPDTTGNVGGN